MKTLTTIAAFALLAGLLTGCGEEENSNLLGPPTTGGSSALLSGLSTSLGTLNPGFQSTHRTYTQFAGSTNGSMTLTARSSKGSSIINVKGPGLAPEGVFLQSGVPSPGIALNMGDNEITVSSQMPNSSTTMEYTITVTRLSN